MRKYEYLDQYFVLDIRHTNYCVSIYSHLKVNKLCVKIYNHNLDSEKAA